MARSVGDVLVLMLGRANLELANMTARAETAEEMLAAAQKELTALKPKPEAKKESSDGG